MRNPSRTLRRHFAVAMGERAYLLGVEKKKEQLDSLVQCMDTPFGAALIEGLEAIEAAAYHTLANTSVWNWPKILQAKAELKIAQYLKAKFMMYVQNLDTINKQLAELNRDVEVDEYGPEA